MNLSKLKKPELVSMCVDKLGLNKSACSKLKKADLVKKLSGSSSPRSPTRPKKSPKRKSQRKSPKRSPKRSKRRRSPKRSKRRSSPRPKKSPRKSSPRPKKSRSTVADRAYGYYKLGLMDGKLKLPLKLVNSIKTQSKFTTKTGYEGRPVNQIRVLANEGVKKPSKLEDIEMVVSWSGDGVTYLEDDNGDLVPIDKYKGLSDLLEENKGKKKERYIEVLGLYDFDFIS